MVLPNSFLVVFFLGLTSLFFLEKMWIWVLTELIFAVMLTELMKRSETLSPIILFIMVEVCLSVCLLGGLLLESESLIYFFCLGKLGLVPLWFWVFRLFSGLDFRSLFSVMSIYKIIPLLMTFVFMKSAFVLSVICFNSLVVFYLFGSGSLSSVLAVLIVFSTGWLISASVGGGFSLALFFLFYILMLSSLLFSENISSNLVMFLFYSGLPPLGSFFSKFFVLVSSSGWGLLFIPLLSGLMLVLAWIFLNVTSKKSSQYFVLIFFLLGVFVCYWSFAEVLAF